MARTKRLARRGRQLPVINSPSVAVLSNDSGFGPSKQTGKIDLDASVDFDDDNGGVSLSMPNNNIDPDDHESRQNYHQHPLATSKHTDCLWQLPVQPIFAYKHTLSQLGITDPIAETYHDCCGVIWSSWKCELEDCIPAALRTRTPFSLALLSQLRRLASHTKHNFESTQRVLLESSQERTQQFTTLPTNIEIHIIRTRVKDPRLSNCENEIDENIFGLMLVDVAKVLQRIPAMSKKAKGRAKHEANLDKLQAGFRMEKDGTSTISDRVKKNPRTPKPIRALHRADRFQAMMLAGMIPGPESPDQVFNGVSAAPPNSPVLTATQPKVEVSDAVMADPVGTPHKSRQSFPPVDENDEARYNPSRYDRHIDWQMTTWFNKMSNMQSVKPLKQKQLKQLEAGGASRKNQTSTELPSERINLHSLRSLQSQVDGAKAAEVASALKGLDLDQG